MKFKHSVAITEIAKSTGTILKGNENIIITGINEIHKAETGDIVYVDNEKYYQSTLNSPASVIIIDKETDVPEGKALLICKEPFKIYKSLVEKYMIREEINPGSFFIHSSSSFGADTVICPNVYIANQVKIGKGCFIHPNVVIHSNCVIGDRVIIKANTVIGSDAFYYKSNPGEWEKWPSCGRVIIEEDVHIGAGVTIDKGVSGDTIIGSQTKIDNLTQIAHGVVVGKRCLIAAQVGIAGKTVIGDDVMIWGQVGITKAINIESGAVLLAQSGVSKSLKGNRVYFGSPAREVMTINKELASLRQLPEFMVKVNKHLADKD